MTDDAKLPLMLTELRMPALAGYRRHRRQGRLGCRALPRRALRTRESPKDLKRLPRGETAPRRRYGGVLADVAGLEPQANDAMSDHGPLRIVGYPRATSAHDCRRSSISTLSKGVGGAVMRWGLHW